MGNKYSYQCSLITLSKLTSGYSSEAIYNGWLRELLRHDSFIELCAIPDNCCPFLPQPFNLTNGNQVDEKKI